MLKGRLIYLINYFAINVRFVDKSNMMVTKTLAIKDTHAQHTANLEVAYRLKGVAPVIDGAFFCPLIAYSPRHIFNREKRLVNLHQRLPIR